MKVKTVDQIKIINNDLMKSIYDELLERDGTKIHTYLTNCVINGHKPIFYEAKEYGIYDEFMIMTKNIKENGFENNYEQGKYKVLEFMINCIIANPINGHYFDEKNRELIIDSKKLLNVKDNLIWNFIPNTFKKTIDVLWNDIE